MISRIIVFTFFVSAWSYSATRISFVGMQSSSIYEAQGVMSSVTPDYGWGTLIETTASGSSSYELGILSYSRTWPSENSYQIITVPLMYNLWLGNYLGIGVGGYVSKGIKEIQIAGQTQTFQDAQFSQSDFGLSGSLKVDLPFEISGLSLLLEARYNYGVSNLSQTDGVKSRMSEYQYLVGLRFGGKISSESAKAKSTK